MKEDKFVSSVMSGALYARENTQSVIIVVLIVVAIIAGGIFLNYSRMNKKEASATQLGLAQIEYKLENYNESKDLLVSLVNEYPKSEAARTGNYLLGHLYFAFGRMDSAKFYWDKTLANKKCDPDMRAASEAGLAGIFSNNREFLAAAEKFEKVYTDFPNYFDRSNMLWLAAVNFQASGNRDKAIELFDKFIQENPESPKTMTAQLLSSELKAY